jgi:hypothetical protein
MEGELDSSFEKRLRERPWGERRTAHRDAGHVPDAIMGLLSPDAGVRRKAYWKIDNYVVLHGDLYEAAFDVVPFLVEIVADRTSPGRDLAYMALFELANGYPVPRDACVAVGGEAIPLRRAIHAELLKHRALFEQDVNDADEDIRRDAFDILECLNEHEGRRQGF